VASSYHGGRGGRLGGSMAGTIKVVVSSGCGFGRWTQVSKGASTSFLKTNITYPFNSLSQKSDPDLLDVLRCCNH